MSRGLSIVQDFDQFYEECYYAWNPFYPLAARDMRFYQGDQWDEKEKQKLFNEGRSAFVFNRVRRNINLITGYQRKNRLSSVVVPMEDSDQETADQLTQLLLYSMNSCDGYRLISDCFGGAIKTGWNLAEVWVDYRDDLLNGDIKIARVPYSGFITDPYFTCLDFSDCSGIQRRKYISPEDASSLLPGHEKDIFKIHQIGWSRDDKFTWLPYQRQPNGQELIAYNEFYQQKWRQVPALVDMESGEYMEWDGDEDRLQLLLRIHPDLKVIKRPQRYIEKHILLNDQYFKTIENQYGLDEYPFSCFVGQFDSESEFWEYKVQSLTRCQIDPQREANRRRSQMTDILDSQINSGYIADADSVVNPRSLFQTSQGKVIWRKKDAKPGAIEKIQPAQIPPGMFQLQELFDRDMMEILGVNDAAFGAPDSGNESGVMMQLRQGAAIVNLQEVFDNLRFSQKTLSMKFVKLIQKWSPEKVKRILNQEPTKQFYEKDFTKYDISIQEGMLTDTQKQMYFRQLVDLKQLGAPVTGEMLAEAAPIQGKTQFTKELAKIEEQQNKQMQEQAQIQSQLVDSQRQMSQAKAISDLALSKERFTRAVANMGLEDERASKAVEDRQMAALAQIRAAKELQGISQDQLMKAIQIVQMLDQMSSNKEQDIKKQDVVLSAQANKAEEGALTQAPGQQPMQPQSPPPMEVNNG